MCPTVCFNKETQDILKCVYEVGKDTGEPSPLCAWLTGSALTNSSQYNASQNSTSNGTKTNQESSNSAQFESNISKLPVGERVAAVKTKVAEVAEKNGWVKDRIYSKMNNRDVYKDPKTGDLYSVDSQHGRFEKCNSKGMHQGEVNIDLVQTKPADLSGGHDLSVK